MNTFPATSYVIQLLDLREINDDWRLVITLQINIIHILDITSNDWV